MFPGFVPRLGRNQSVTWTGTLQPGPESASYTVRMLLARSGVPRVFVLNPVIRPNAPHRYRDLSLCLYWPDEWRWTAGAQLSKTIVPWTAIWLWYYEAWLATGDWLGPSSHVDVREEEPRGG